MAASVLIIPADQLARIPEVRIVDRNDSFARAEFGSLQIDYPSCVSSPYVLAGVLAIWRSMVEPAITACVRVARPPEPLANSNGFDRVWQSPGISVPEETVTPLTTSDQISDLPGLTRPHLRSRQGFGQTMVRCPPAE